MLSPRQKIVKARWRLIKRHPFFGNLALYLRLREAKVKTCCIDEQMDKLFYNPDFISSLHQNEVEFVVAHEICHIILDHFSRRGKRDIIVADCEGNPVSLWNVACDFAANDILERAKIGLRPRLALYKSEFKGKSAEKIYEILKERLQEREELPIDGKLLDEHPEIKGVEKESLEDKMEEWKRRVVMAAEAVKERGDLPAEIRRLVKNITTDQLDCYAMLAQFIRRTAKDDYSYCELDRRFIHSGIRMPDLHSRKSVIGIAIDTSGSITDKELKTFLSKTLAIIQTLPSPTTHLFFCDAEVHCYRKLESWEDPDLEEMNIEGGGETDFRPVFNKIEEENIDLDALVYLTDGWGIAPTDMPPYPVLWIITKDGKMNVASWGEKIRLED